jgi:hypothetical protein
VRNVGVGKVCSRAEQFLSQAVGERIAKAVAEIQSRGMTSTLSVAPPGCARYPHVLDRYWLNLDLSASEEQVQLLAASFSRLTFEHDRGLQKACGRYSPGASGSQAAQQAFGPGLLSQNSHDG